MRFEARDNYGWIFMVKFDVMVLILVERFESG